MHRQLYPTRQAEPDSKPALASTYRSQVETGQSTRQRCPNIVDAPHLTLHVCSFCTLCPRGGSVANPPSFDSTSSSSPCPLSVPVGPLVNAIFNPLLVVAVGAPPNFLFEVVAVVKQKATPQAQFWLIVVYSPPTSCPRTRTPSSWALMW